MANKGIGATFRISTGEKYSVDRDGRSEEHTSELQSQR